MTSKSPAEYLALFTPNWGPPTEREQELYAAVGSALSTWTLLEWQVTLIHASITHAEGSSPLGAFASFSSVSSFDSRIRMVDHALRYTLPLKTDEHSHAHEEWNRLSKKLRNNAKKRHELAHGVVEGERNEIGPFWIPFAHHAGLIAEDIRAHLGLHPDLKTVKRMSKADIVNREHSFQRLHDDLKKYREAVLFPLMNRIDSERRQRDAKGVER